MNRYKKISIIGGDTRQVYLANRFSEVAEVKIYANENERLNDCILHASTLQEALTFTSNIICPIPFSKDGKHVFVKHSDEKIPYEQLFTDELQDKLLLSGPFNWEIIEAASDKNIKLIDITNTEEFAIYNSIPTAEGVISIAINHLDVTLFGSRCLVLGYGKCGKAIANLMKQFEALVTICTKSSYEQQLANIHGYRAIGFEQLEGKMSRYHCIVNTIPIKVFEPKTTDLKNDFIFIDIANAYLIHHEQFINARGIPGVYSPKTASDIIFRVIHNILNHE